MDFQQKILLKISKKDSNMDYLKEILFNRESYPKMIERGNLT